MFIRLFARLFPAAPVARFRLGVEPLEDRLTPNNRFVVPYGVTADGVTNFHSLAAALTTFDTSTSTGIGNGSVIEVEPFSIPGVITNANLAAMNATNVTVRGAAGFAPSELPVITDGDDINVTAADTGLTLQNLNLRLDYQLEFYTNGSIRGCSVLVGATGHNGILFSGTTAAVLQGNTIADTGGMPSTLVLIDTGMNSADLIDGNTIISTSRTSTLLNLSTQYSGVISDVVSNNTLIRADAQGSIAEAPMAIFYQAPGVTIRNNTFKDAGAFNTALVIYYTTGVQVLDNVFALNYAANSAGAALDIEGQAGNGASGTVRGNSFSTGPNGRAINLAVNEATTFDVKVERNTFLENKVGVNVTATAVTAAVGHIDLGGGALGSAGGNNFRGFRTAATSTSGAVVLNSGTYNTSAQTLSAQGDLFGVADPEAVIWDKADGFYPADVLPTGNLTANGAFVQALYTRYLHRVGNVSNANDAGAWVNAMANGLPAATVANGIIRSPEALGYAVDDLYRTILGRDADAYGRQYHVNLLANGWTVEQVQMGLYGGAEYAVRLVSNNAYVTSLFTTLLDRVPSAADLNAWLNLLPTLGRGGVAAGFINSIEYRNRVVKGLFFDLLKRTTATAPSAPDIAAWVNTGQDVLNLRTSFAASAEFYVVG
jgi:hypothetical protein